MPACGWLTTVRLRGGAGGRERGAGGRRRHADTRRHADPAPRRRRVADATPSATPAPMPAPAPSAAPVLFAGATAARGARRPASRARAALARRPAAPRGRAASGRGARRLDADRARGGAAQPHQRHRSAAPDVARVGWPRARRERQLPRPLPVLLVDVAGQAWNPWRAVVALRRRGPDPRHRGRHSPRHGAAQMWPNTYPRAF